MTTSPAGAAPEPPGLMLNKAHYPVTSLGPGTRAGIWTQGCTIGCAGCVSEDTWAADPATSVDVDALLGWIASLPRPLDGVTVSGGEPFQQPKALTRLLQGVDVWRAGQSLPIDILVYSGYSLSWLRKEHPDILSACDAVITGRYVERLNRPGLNWRGSANQRVTPLTELGHERYGDAEEPAAESPRMQVSVEGGRIWFIGIPHRGDMDRLDDRLRTAGITTGDVSWRS
ncbi:4Fe-4S single cluster domain-containing protein [Streptomyces sp. SS]|uniref:4Fe-4S single cluster domain-containing protein n=1 Tax=Streptomyces sp. SS TaxID=260742 RepID=UPI0002F840A4|nr:4Fe-4S single cluster domain-containing protein [Streptomyces sp. SS]